jgi:cell division protein FtsB
VALAEQAPPVAPPQHPNIVQRPDFSQQGNAATFAVLGMEISRAQAQVAALQAEVIELQARIADLQKSQPPGETK